MTLTEIFKKRMADGLANSILIKLNQIGTVKLWNASKPLVSATGPQGLPATGHEGHERLTLARPK